jgi:hypothetical protein
MSQTATIEIRFFDRPELDMVFADHLQSIASDGALLRLEFAQTRVSNQEVPGKQIHNRHPVARLVIPLSTAALLQRQIGEIAQVRKSLTEPPSASKN